MKALGCVVLALLAAIQDVDRKKILETGAATCLPCDGSGKLESIIPGQGPADCHYCKGAGKPKVAPIFYTAEELSKAWKAKEVKFGGAPLIVAGAVKEAKVAGLLASVRLDAGADVTVIQGNLFGQAKRAANLKVGERITLYALFLTPPKGPDQTTIVLTDCRILDVK